MNISIIVPVFNSAKYLEKCINSLLKQNIDNTEIILVDDGSTDNSQEIIKEYSKKNSDRIVCILNEENHKQGAARNMGIKIARGKYITFVDSDDWISNEYCNKMYRLAEEGDYDIVYCDYYREFEKDGNKIYNVLVDNSQVGRLDHEKRKSLLLRMDSYPWGRLIKKDLLIHNSLYFPEKIYYEDLAITHLYNMYTNDIAKVEEPLYHYRIHQSSTVANPINLEYQLKAVNLLIENFVRRDLYHDYLEEMEFLYIKEYYLYTLYDCFHKCEEPPLELMFLMKDTVSSKYPLYAENKYMKTLAEPFLVKMAKLNDISPYLLIESYNKGSIKK
jgi:glycosyltransferase involved in cell wall biosynthesis